MVRGEQVGQLPGGGGVLAVGGRKVGPRGQRVGFELVFFGGGGCRRKVFEHLPAGVAEQLPVALFLGRGRREFLHDGGHLGGPVGFAQAAGEFHLQFLALGCPRHGLLQQVDGLGPAVEFDQHGGPARRHFGILGMVFERLLVVVGQTGQILLPPVKLLDPRAGLAFEPTAGFCLGDDALVDLDGLGGVAPRLLDLTHAQGGVDAPEGVVVLPGQLADLFKRGARLVVSLVLLERLADLLQNAGIVGKLGGQLAPCAQRRRDEETARLRARQFAVERGPGGHGHGWLRARRERVGERVGGRAEMALGGFEFAQRGPAARIVGMRGVVLVVRRARLVGMRAAFGEQAEQERERFRARPAGGGPRLPARGERVQARPLEEVLVNLVERRAFRGRGREHLFVARDDRRQRRGCRLRPRGCKNGPAQGQREQGAEKRPFHESRAAARNEIILANGVLSIICRQRNDVPPK